MKNYVYIASIRNKWISHFDFMRLFHTREQAEEFLIGQGFTYSFTYSFNDEYIKNSETEELIGVIRLYEIGENNNEKKKKI